MLRHKTFHFPSQLTVGLSRSTEMPQGSNSLCAILRRPTADLGCEVEVGEGSGPPAPPARYPLASNMTRFSIGQQ